MSHEGKGHSSALIAQEVLARDMLEFVRQIPASANLEWVKDFEFLFFFEAERLLSMRRALLDVGFRPEQKFEVLDFGYLHGLVPEFLYRFFPNARFTVLDHPDSPNFRNLEYLNLIRHRTYLSVEACNILDVDKRPGEFDLIVLGEIIEHLNPTVTATAAEFLRKKVHRGGTLLITTPNGAGVHNAVYTFFGRDAQHAPLPDATMSYGHIHLWTPTLLQKTLEHFGWSHAVTHFNHGFDRILWKRANHCWGSLAHQVMTRSLFLAAQLCPKWRAFMVTAYKPNTAFTLLRDAH